MKLRLGRAADDPISCGALADGIRNDAIDPDHGECNGAVPANTSNKIAWKRGLDTESENTASIVLMSETAWSGSTSWMAASTERAI